MSSTLFCLAEEEGDYESNAPRVLPEASSTSDSFKTMFSSSTPDNELKFGLMFCEGVDDDLKNGLADRQLMVDDLTEATTKFDNDSNLGLASLLDIQEAAEKGKEWDPDHKTLDLDNDAQQVVVKPEVPPRRPSQESARGEATQGGKQPQKGSLLYQLEHDDDNHKADGQRQFFKLLTDDEIGGFGSTAEGAPGLMAHPDVQHGSSSMLWGSQSTLGYTRTTPAASTDLISALSETSEHSAFSSTDRLPLPQAQAPTTVKRTPRMMRALPPTLTEMGTTRPLRILLVDDNPVILQSQSRQLEMLGYHCQLANNGKVALDITAKEPIDVILLDLHMPEMDGFETAAAINHKYPAEIRPTIIAVTASQSADESLRCLSVGIKYYLAKPLGVTELATILCKCQRIQEPEPKPSQASAAKTVQTIDTPASQQKTLTRKGSW